MIRDTIIQYSNVHLGENLTLDAFLVLGKPPKGAQDGELETRIGDNSILRSHSVIYAGTIIGADFQCGHQVTIREHTIIGDNVSVGTGTVVEHRVVIKNGVRLHSQVFVPEFSVLHEDCWLGPNVVVTNAKYPQSPEVKENLQGAIIMARAKIGANSTLLPGITIGEDSLIGAGTTVVENVPPRTVVVGNPGRIIKTLDELPYS